MAAGRPRPSEKALRTDGKKFAVVAARFNGEIVDKLVDGAVRALARAGVKANDVAVHRCPGALEIPGLARRLADTGRYQGLVCLGVVIRGDTLHFDLVAEHAVGGVAEIADEGRIGVGNCILACETPEQARDRAGGRLGNRGADAADAALEMASQYDRIPLPPRTRTRRSS